MVFSFQGLAHGIMGCVGLGSVWNPMSKYQKQLSDAQSKLDATVQQGTLAVMAIQGKEITQTIELVNIYNQYYQEEFKYASSMSKFQESEETTSTLILAAIIIIIFTYLILKT
jgi:hypothetical protein